MPRPRKHLAIGALAAAVALTATPATAHGGRSSGEHPAPSVSASPSSSAGLAAVRAWTSRYRTEEAAIAAGFVRTDECVPQMGYHYIHPDRFDGRFQPSRPEALMYVDGPDGTRVLAGAEWLVIDADQDLATDQDRPAVFGHEFDGPMPGHAPGMPVHYDLHAWAWLDNPDGAFTAFNPAVECPEH